ncbi:DNA-directed DNA polymerase alpha subunit POL12 Ecym_7448 [Eremothecium cymbalariae DBVPG|uniref:DNA polymerase alpha subunit B n=1 Tax=Eremothecium cymbalariae (strain CBS 270.75 / DBVPG 7215 / KCTC 17166 / NRRL Y-17582) TaxID=931890 RepID=G8JWQ3_ERECY|nr:hypothetical protein Ecym_7448 [Eremothecium cymbalariae DBVPG\
MTTQSKLVTNFGPEADDVKIIGILESYMKLYALSVDELYIRWEQFSYHNQHLSLKLDESTLQNFKLFIQQQIEKKGNISHGSVNSPGASNSGRNPNLGKKPKMLRPTGGTGLFGFGGSPNTPVVKKRKLEDRSFLKNELQADGSSPIVDTRSSPIFNGENSSAGTPYSMKETAFPDKIIDTLNPDLPIGEGIDFNNESKVKMVPLYDQKKYKYRTMRQNLLDSADVLDEQINIFTDIIQERYNLGNSDLGDPTIQSQSALICTGRIVPDTPCDERLNMDSVAIETSRSAGIGRRIRLNLDDVKECSLFPGQLIALRGKNANGEYFKVEEILELPYLDFPVSSIQDIQESQLTLDSQMKIVVTSGPYTPKNSFDFTNFSEFVERINTKIKPHVLIMFGPFLDISHPLIKTGGIPKFPNLKFQPRTMDEIFLKVLAPILKNLNPKIQVILIPSTKDVLSKHVSYPQDAFSRRELQLPKNFKCVTNPATFQLNELFFGCSNNDIFKDVKEIPKGPNTLSKNRLDRVAEHILQQRRFYPLFPGNINTCKTSDDGTREHISGADLEVPYLGLTEFVGDFIPDVIIIPSELTHFARVVKNVVFINPGPFVRAGGSRGTYIQISISPPDVENGNVTKVADKDIYLHNVWKRARIDILTA